MKLTTAKQGLFEQFARIGKAVASPARLTLLDLLAQGEKPVETLARQAGLSVTNTSNHLKELRTAGLVATRREGAYIHYRLADPEVSAFLGSLQRLAHRRLADVKQIVADYFEARDALEPIDANELERRLDGDDVVVIDVRPRDEYEAGHVPGALSMPVSELERRLDELPADREIIAYCRGPYCVLALEAMDRLRAHGFHVRRMADGWPAWRRAGFARADRAPARPRRRARGRDSP
ncbi:MAG: ArsR/SmtB family transcription factor [Gemmatimonadota bacterium]